MPLAPSPTLRSCGAAGVGGSRNRSTTAVASGWDSQLATSYPWKGLSRALSPATRPVACCSTCKGYCQRLCVKWEHGRNGAQWRLTGRVVGSL